MSNQLAVLSASPAALVNHAEPKVIQLSVPCQAPDYSLLNWLAAQHASCKIFWQARDQQRQLAALDTLLEHKVDPGQDLTKQLDNCQDWLKGAQGEPSILGGIAFTPTTSQWQHFGAGRFVIPRLELVAESDSWSLRCNLQTASSPQRLQQSLAQTKALLLALRCTPEVVVADAATEQAADPNPRQLPAIISCEFTPDFYQWTSMVDRAMAQLKSHQQKKLQKVVLSRKGTVQFNRPLPALQLLEQWHQLVPHSFAFAMQFADNDCFIGCSPERLLRRRGCQLETEALAGTTVRSGDEQADKAHAEALLRDPKNLHENQLVSEQIVRRLEPLCQTVEPSGELSVVKLRMLQHLKVGLRGELIPGVSDGQLLEALHPTPAVGGSPRLAALQFITEHEPYDRGWYAGAVGRMSPSETDFCVAIRSARVRAQQAEVFSGAGIVEGSEPGLEWQELGNKLKSLFSLLVT